MGFLTALRSFFRWIADRIALPLYHGWLWLRNRALLLVPCRFPILMVAVGGAAMIIVPQGQDLLRGMAERNVTAQLFFFTLCGVLWPFQVWYWSRIMLLIEFPNLVFDIRNARHALLIRTAAPRIIGFLAAISIAMAFLRASFSYGPGWGQERCRLLCYALAFTVWSVVFLLFVVYRRSMSRAIHRYVLSVRRLQGPVASGLANLFAVPSSGELPYNTMHLRRFPLKMLIMAGFFPLLAVVLFLLFVFCLLETAPVIGATAIMLLALSGWTAMGSVFDIAALRLRFPVITFVIVLAFLFSMCNDNHAVFTLSRDRDAPRTRVTVQQAIEAWYKRQVKHHSPNDKFPMFLVSAEGGGIRAAFWTASVLARIQDSNPCFADQLFAISGVSGGSLGSAVFLAQLADDRDSTGGFRCDEYGRPSENRKFITTQAQNILGEDFLAPVMGAMLYPDLVQRFLPCNINRFDRGRALERAWERAWKLHAGTDRFSSQFELLWAGRTDVWMPSLFLNSTWVETGKRIIISNLDVAPDVFSDAEDINDFYSDRSLSLSSAVHLSARFTYISPAGSLVKNKKIYGRAVDGGYFENSGDTTLLEILRSLDKLDSLAQVIVPVVIHITNEPVDPEYGVIHIGTEEKDKKTTPNRCLNEFLSPPITLLNTRNARGIYAMDAVKSYVAEMNIRHRHYVKRSFFRFGLCKNRMSIPLGWVLSSSARRRMNEQLESNPCGEYQNRDNLREIDNLLRRRYNRALAQ
ncbi:MAG: hypothetical protein JW807_14255 [Spirochaetes bacterium]|nr:hypothetical protein [Spirochaetota bacterium]